MRFISKEPDSPPRRSRWRTFGILVLVIAIMLGIARLFLPWIVRDYVNRTLDRSQVYQGKIGEVRLHLLRGAYSIQDVRLVKVTGEVPVPLFAADQVDLAVQWNALFHRRVVGQIVINRPQLNFVDAPNDAEAQTGAGGPWLEIIKQLFPFKINRASIRDGSIHFRTYQSRQPVDVYLSQLDGSIDDLTNIRNDTAPLVSTIKAHGLAMDQGRFEFEMKMNPFAYQPAFHAVARLLGLDVTKINDLAVAYGQFDFKHGFFDLVVEADAKEGQTVGYIKPLFRNIQVLDIAKDAQRDDPLRFFWQALVGLTTEILKNHPRDQFGTLIPFSIDTTGTKPDILATIGNLLRNAFIRAYLPKLEPSDDNQGMHFGPSSVTDPVSAGDEAQ